MKTVNLTPWCNLFSNASKYKIGVKKSHYKDILYAVVAFVFVLLLLIFFTYAYHVALSIAVVVTLLLGLALSKKNNQQNIVSTFELNSQGQCLFERDTYYQLHVNSRVSFLGCWLFLQPISAMDKMFHVKNNKAKKLLFIYRDSLSKQDFSRLSNVISQL